MKNIQIKKHAWVVVVLLVFSVWYLMMALRLEVGPIKIIRYFIMTYFAGYLACLDIESRIVPNKILLFLLVARVVLFLPEIYLYPEYAAILIKSSVISSIAVMVILLLGYFICKKGMGFGDIKLFGVIGLYLNLEAAMCVLLFSLLAAALYSITKLIQKKIKPKDEIPFVPFVFLGMIITGSLGI